MKRWCGRGNSSPNANSLLPVGRGKFLGMDLSVTQRLGWHCISVTWRCFLDFERDVFLDVPLRIRLSVRLRAQAFGEQSLFLEQGFIRALSNVVFPRRNYRCSALQTASEETIDRCVRCSMSHIFGFVRLLRSSGTVALREIRKYQKSTELLIRKLPFQRLVVRFRYKVYSNGNVCWFGRRLQDAGITQQEYSQSTFALKRGDSVRRVRAAAKRGLFLFFRILIDEDACSSCMQYRYIASPLARGRGGSVHFCHVLSFVHLGCLSSQLSCAFCVRQVNILWSRIALFFLQIAWDRTGLQGWVAFPVVCHSGPARGCWGLPRLAVRGYQLVRHSRQTCTYFPTMSLSQSVQLVLSLSTECVQLSTQYYYQLHPIQHEQRGDLNVAYAACGFCPCPKKFSVRFPVISQFHLGLVLKRAPSTRSCELTRGTVCCKLLALPWQSMSVLTRKCCCLFKELWFMCVGYHHTKDIQLARRIRGERA